MAATSFLFDFSISATIELNKLKTFSLINEIDWLKWNPVID